MKQGVRAHDEANCLGPQQSRRWRPACAGPWRRQSVKIGFVSTFSGPQAAIGEDMRRSVELAKEHLGGKMAGKPIEIVYEDDQFKPDVGKARSEKLVQQDKVNFVAGYIWSNVLLASLKTVTDEGDTILISANAGPSQIAGELCNKNFFSTSWQQRPDADGDGRVPATRRASRAST